MKMKTIILAAQLLTLSSNAFSNDKNYFEEGTETNLSREQVQDILPWAQNTKALLVKLLATTSNLTYLDKNYALIQGIRQGVLASAPHNTELAMRYILNRANKIYKVMRSSPHANEPMAVDAQNRLLTYSIHMAIKYFKSDMQALSQAQAGQVVKNITYAFAFEYQNFLGTLSQFSFYPQVNYKIQHLRMSYFVVDLFRLRDNKTFANTILETRNLTKQYSKRPPVNDQMANRAMMRMSNDFQKVLNQIETK